MAMIQLNVRLDPETIRLIGVLQAALAVSQADVIRLAVRQLAAEPAPRPPKKKPENPGNGP
jgi:hypothetical protein